MPKNATTGVKKETPLLTLSRVTHKDLKTKVRSETYDQIGRYVEFYSKATGIKPEPDEVVEGALSGFFRADKGFQKFLKNGKATGGGNGAVSAAN
jgi:hypothetical protein